MEMPAATHRPDVDIEEDIAQLIRSYSPLKASRQYFSFKSHAGKVILDGNVRSPQARRVLVDNVPHIPGVTGLDANSLYDDETIRMTVGGLLPTGVFANVHYGAVALTGRLPTDTTSDGLLKTIGAVPGVRRVGAEFGIPAGPDPSETRGNDPAPNL